MRPCLTPMETAVEIYSLIPATGRTKGNRGRGGRGSLIPSVARKHLCLCRALQRTASFETEAEHTRTSPGHYRKLLMRVLTLLCPTLALRCWHLLVRLSSAANRHKSSVSIHLHFGCQRSDVATCLRSSPLNSSSNSIRFSRSCFITLPTNRLNVLWWMSVLWGLMSQ